MYWFVGESMIKSVRRGIDLANEISDFRSILDSFV